MSNNPSHEIPQGPQKANGYPTEEAGASELALLQQYLSLRTESCPSCGYELHALTSRRCPECGQVLRLRVGLEQPNMGAFLAGLIGLAATAGFGGLFLVFVLAMIIVEGRSMDAGGVAYTFFGIALVSSALLVGWIKLSGRIRRAAPMRRAILASACWAYALATLVIVYALLGW